MAGYVSGAIKKAKSKRSFKRRYRRNYRRKPVLLNSVNLGLGFPKKLVATLKYHENLYITCTAGGVQNQQFKLNGLYDPNITGTGHQPMYFDQYMALYNHFTVIGARIKVTLFQDALTYTHPCYAVLWQNDDSTIGFPNMQDVSEYSKAYNKCIVNGTNPRYMTMKWSAKKTFGPPMANTLLRGNVGADPQETTVATIMVQPMDQATSVTLWGSVDIEYITVFTELKDTDGS